MKATELRIGNYVIDTEDSNVYQIVGGLSINNSHLMSPIALTEEWLLKFGFEKVVGFYRKPLPKKGIIWFNSETYSCELGTKEGYSFAFVDCKNVHQLQNLYFALTREELTLNT